MGWCLLVKPVSPVLRLVSPGTLVSQSVVEACINPSTFAVDNHTLQMGGLISTNNLILKEANHVTVTCTQPLLWTMSHKLCHYNIAVTP